MELTLWRVQEVEAAQVVVVAMLLFVQFLVSLVLLAMGAVLLQPLQLVVIEVAVKVVQQEVVLYPSQLQLSELLVLNPLFLELLHFPVQEVQV